MEGSSSSSSNNSGDAVEPKSGCGCSSATVNNNNDPSSVATATTAKMAKMTDTNNKFIARAMTTEKIRQENFRLKQEEQKHKLQQVSTDERHQVTSGSANTNGSSPAANGSSTAVSVDETSEITITVSPTTGGQFDLSVLKTDSVESLKKVISKRLRVPKERICLLYRER